MSDTRPNSPPPHADHQHPSPAHGSAQQAMSDPSSRRALLLQALLARQQPTGRGAGGSPLGGSVGSPASPASANSPTVPLPEVPLAPGLSRVLSARPPPAVRGDSIPLGLSLGEGALSEALMTGNWDQVVKGLDAAADEGQNRDWTENRVSNQQLDQAQKALEAWANNHKPTPIQPPDYNQPPHPPRHYGNSSSPTMSSSAQSPAPFPWAALYPHTASPAPPLANYHHSLPLPHHSPHSTQPLHSTSYYDTSNPPTRSQSFSEELPTISPPNGVAAGAGKKGKAPPKKGSTKKPTPSGATIAAGEAAERAAEEESARVAQANMTPEEIEEDKRRRNT